MKGFLESSLYVCVRVPFVKVPFLLVEKHKEKDNRYFSGIQISLRHTPMFLAAISRKTGLLCLGCQLQDDRPGAVRAGEAVGGLVEGLAPPVRRQGHAHLAEAHLSLAENPCENSQNAGGWYINGLILQHGRV